MGDVGGGVLARAVIGGSGRKVVFSRFNDTNFYVKTVGADEPAVIVEVGLEPTALAQRGDAETIFVGTEEGISVWRVRASAGTGAPGPKAGGRSPTVPLP